ncbi:MAG TPA: hypothetical protein VJN21_13115 [Candidatus Acidoferrales bacterium]|nr:hypothetical protein [Candidatus Acidoferrales bacterium]
MAETPKSPNKPATLKASAPKVPGVLPPKPKKLTPPKPLAKSGTSVAAPQQKAPAFLWAVGIVILVVFLIGAFWLMNGSKRQASTAASVNAAVPTMPTKPPLIVKSAKLPVAPGVIATTDELTQPWSAKKFLFRNAKGKTSAAMVVRLPDNSYWAFSLREPYGSCDLEYVTDLDKLSSEYRFQATHPMVVNTCTRTVFDLNQYGSGPTGEVRGDIVAGTGVRPPLAIEVDVNGKSILATRAEPDIMQ